MYSYHFFVELWRYDQDLHELNWIFLTKHKKVKFYNFFFIIDKDTKCRTRLDLRF